MFLPPRASRSACRSGPAIPTAPLCSPGWGPNQQATATVFAPGVLNEACYSEVELRLHSSLSAHSSLGYKVGFKVSQTSAAYLIITRRGGAYGDDIIYLFKAIGAQFGVKNGDVVSARVVGNVITAYKNGVQMAQVTDATFTTGNPGMGFTWRTLPPAAQGPTAITDSPTTPQRMASSPEVRQRRPPSGRTRNRRRGS